jgi:hypothetical protein
MYDMEVKGTTTTRQGKPNAQFKTLIVHLPLFYCDISIFGDVQ